MFKYGVSTNYEFEDNCFLEIYELSLVSCFFPSSTAIPSVTLVTDQYLLSRVYLQ